VNEAIVQIWDGRAADLHRPQPDWFDVRAVAASLASKTRFCGQASARMTIAEHCVRMSRLTSDPTLAIYALLHECDEHLLPDIPAPLKRAPEMEWYRTLCEKHQAAGHAHFGLAYPRSPDVEAWIRAADLTMLATEARDLMAPADWWSKVEPLPDRIVPMSPDVAEQEFLGRYNYLNALRSAA
jgi:hypothetical protein